MRITLPLSICLLPLAAQTVKLPPSQRLTPPNGATVVLAPGSDIPMVNVRVILRGGNESDPEGKAGLSTLTATLLRRGTATRTVDQIDRQLDFLGATLSSFSGPQNTTLAAEFLEKDTAAALDILSDVLANPAFPDAEVKKQLAQSIDGAKASKDNPGAAINQYFRPFFYGTAHPYGRVSDELSLGRITRDDILAQYRRMYTGRNMILVVTGRFDPKTMQPMVLKLASVLPAGEAYSWVKAAPPRFAEPRLLLIDKPDATQTYFFIAMPGIERTHPDRVPLRLVNTLFGGRFTSMLNDALRVNSGLTYGASSQVELNRLPGAIYISTYTKTETTEKAIDLALDILRELREKGMTPEMLASVKAYEKGNFPTDELETSAQLASMFGELELFGLSRGEVDDLFPKIDSVSVEQANEIARQHYTAANLQFCLVGNAGKIKGVVAKYASKMKIIPIKDPGIPTW